MPAWILRIRVFQNVWIFLKFSNIYQINDQVNRYMRTIIKLIRIETFSNLWKIHLILNTTLSYIHFTNLNHSYQDNILRVVRRSLFMILTHCLNSIQFWNMGFHILYFLQMISIVFNTPTPRQNLISKHFPYCSCFSSQHASSQASISSSSLTSDRSLR